MLELILTHAPNPAREADLRQAIASYTAAVRASAGRADRGQVAQAEAEVRANPARAFAFDASGCATLEVSGRRWCAGQFEVLSIGALKKSARHQGPTETGDQVRLWVFDGAGPATDIGSLQATGDSNTVFQVASQFNCLESPGPYITRVSNYFTDPTQGPRASISAFPAALLRTYAAPGPGGERFVQQTDGRQIELLADACGPGVAPNGYLTGDGVADPQALAIALENHFDAIRLGVHDNAQVVLGYNWDGAVEGDEPRLIAQVFTSTVAGGLYGGKGNLGQEAFATARRQLLRAAYLGTLLAAAALGRTRVVLTLIGGGVFGNPIPLIWEAILWAIEAAEPYLGHDLDVFLNGRNLGAVIDLETSVLPVVQARRGAILSFDRSGLVAIRR